MYGLNTFPKALDLTFSGLTCKLVKVLDCSLTRESSLSY